MRLAVKNVTKRCNGISNIGVDDKSDMHISDRNSDFLRSGPASLCISSFVGRMRYAYIHDAIAAVVADPTIAEENARLNILRPND